MNRINIDYQLTTLEADFTAKKTGIENKIRDLRVLIEKERAKAEALISDTKICITELEKELALLKQDHIASKAEIMKLYVSEECE